MMVYSQPAKAVTRQDAAASNWRSRFFFLDLGIPPPLVQSRKAGIIALCPSVLLYESQG